MADSILSSLLAKSAALTIVRSVDTGNKNVAEKFRVAQVSVQFRSRPMRHMREDGISIVDARIIDATILNINVFCATLDEVRAVNTILEDRTSVYTVSSRGLVFRNMTMYDMAIIQSPEMLTASPIQFSMKQLKKQGGDEVKHPVVEQAPDSSITGQGIKIVTEAVQSINDLTAKVIRGGFNLNNPL